MRKTTIMLFSAVFMTAVCFTCCDKNPNNGGGDNYPSTANVIRDAVEDIDGNKYDAVKIGDQVWMAQNLRTTRYADGTSIPLGNTPSSVTPFRYAPGSGETNEENISNVENYGYLYNWPAVMHGENYSQSNPSGVQGICPDGWHVPSEAEWEELFIYVFHATGNDYNIAKPIAATWGWNSSSVVNSPGNNPATNNATGFGALPAGAFYNHPADNIDHDISQDFGIKAFFWSATEAYTNYATYIVLC